MNLFVVSIITFRKSLAIHSENELVKLHLQSITVVVRFPNNFENINLNVWLPHSEKEVSERL